MTTTQSKVLDVFKKVREKLEPEGAWLQGKMAADEFGKSMSIHDPEATCFCLVGALLFVKGYNRIEFHSWLLRHILGFNFSVYSIPCWNDQPERTKKDVLDLLTTATNTSIPIIAITSVLDKPWRTSWRLDGEELGLDSLELLDFLIEVQRLTDRWPQVEDLERMETLRGLLELLEGTAAGGSKP